MATETALVETRFGTQSNGDMKIRVAQYTRAALKTVDCGTYVENRFKAPPPCISKALGSDKDDDHQLLGERTIRPGLLGTGSVDKDENQRPFIGIQEVRNHQDIEESQVGVEGASRFIHYGEEIHAASPFGDANFAERIQETMLQLGANDGQRPHLVKVETEGRIIGVESRILERRGSKRGQAGEYTATSIQDNHSHIQELEQDLSKCKLKLRDYQEQVEHLRLDLEREKAMCAEIKLSAEHMQMHMDSREMFVGVQLADEKIHEEYNRLLNRLRTWSSKFQTRSKPLREVYDDRKTLAEFQSVAPACLKPNQHAFWHSQRRSKAFIRGWAGLVMTKLLFRSYNDESNQLIPTFDRWMTSELRKGVSEIEAHLWAAERSKISLRHVNDWRAVTIELLSRVDMGKDASRSAESDLRREARRIMNTIGVFGPTSNAEITKMEDNLLSILLSAMNFSRILRQQRAHWIVRGATIPDGQITWNSTDNDKSIQFNSTSMRDIDEDDESEVEPTPEATSKKIVEIFIAPGLFKSGDADGENYDFETCIEPILVQCKKQPLED